MKAQGQAFSHGKARSGGRGGRRTGRRAGRAGAGGAGADQLDGQPDEQDHHLRPGRHAQRHADEQRRGDRRALGRLRPGDDSKPASQDVLYKVTSPSERLRHGRGRVFGRRDAAADHVLPLPVGGRRDLRRASNSDVIPVQVKPSLGKPTCPSSVEVGQEVHGQRLGQAGRAHGTGRQDQGLPQEQQRRVRLLQELLDHGLRHDVLGRIKISQTGKYKFKAVTAASAQFAASESSFSASLPSRSRRPRLAKTGRAGSMRLPARPVAVPLRHAGGQEPPAGRMLCLSSRLGQAE